MQTPSVKFLQKTSRFSLASLTGIIISREAAFHDSLSRRPRNSAHPERALKVRAKNAMSHSGLDERYRRNKGGRMEGWKIGKASEQEYLAFLRRHELSFDDKYLWH
jgi:hypothetical protein